MADLPERPARMLATARRELTPPDGARDRVYARVLAAAGGVAAVTTTAAKVAAGLGPASVAPPAGATIAAWTLAAKIGAPLLVTATIAGSVAYQRDETRQVTGSTLASPSRPLESVVAASARPGGGAPAPAYAAPASADGARGATEVHGERSSPATKRDVSSPVRRISPSSPAAPIRRNEATEPQAPETVKPAPPAQGPSVDGEVQLLREASEALHAADPDRALEALRTHEAAHPTGVLALERLALRVFALCRAGRIDEAQRERTRYLSIAPDAPMAARVRATCVKDGQR